MPDLRDQLQTTLSGSYTLERELTGGGMSRVFVANDDRLDRPVVVKVLSPDLAAGISAERFEREIKLAASLQQANIVPVLSAGDTNGLPFYTMPYVEGESLRARLGKLPPLSTTEVLRILGDVARALQYAHERGIVHRDIKPDNVLLSGGTAVVTDFGIAKALSAARTTSDSATITQLGTSIGTPAYMAPEQAAGDPDVDHRVDIYAFGCMAYELLAGRPPFHNRTPQRVLAAHMGEAPESLAELRPDVSPSLADLVMRCLAKDSASRPSNAADLIRLLDAVTSGGMPAMPAVLLGGPGMLRKALVIYALSFVAVAILAKTAIVGIGLPDWVYPGSLIIMALGLPIILWTGYVQRVTRRAITTTPTYTPGGSVSMAHGTMATMAMKASPHMSWSRTAKGGVLALSAFVVLIAAFMTLRAMGIGPFGSLLASGALKAREPILLTDFTSTNGDSALGRVVSDAVRAGLNESSVMSLVSPAEIAASLQRMKRAPNSRVDMAVARQMAERDGIKAIADGEITQIGTSYVVAVRLVTADSGKELVSYRATAKDAQGLISASDELARKLRAKVGESLRRVQNAPSLERVTTGSLEALRKYSDGVRAADAYDNVKAVRALREAVAIDPSFGSAWRRLGAAMGNLGLPRSSVDSVLQRAYELRDRMSEHERDIAVAYYYGSGPGHDRAKAIATYESMVARGDSAGSLNNLALAYQSRREYARAETLFARGVESVPTSQLRWMNLVTTYMFDGRFRQADSVLTEVIHRFPGSASPRQLATGLWRDRGELERVARAIDSSRRAPPDPNDPSWALHIAAGLASERGQLRLSRSLRAQALALDSSVGRTPSPLREAANRVHTAHGAHLPVEQEVRALEAALSRWPLERMPVVERPYTAVAAALALGGRTDRARQVLARFDAEVKDTAFKRAAGPDVHSTLAALALAERRWSDAASEFRKSDSLPDGPAHACAHCLPLTLLYVFSTAGMTDSALAAFESYKRTSFGGRALKGPDMSLGAWGYEILAHLYEEKGDAVKAAEYYRIFIELWRNADPELQPRVADAQRRLAKLIKLDRPKG